VCSCADYHVCDKNISCVLMCVCVCVWFRYELPDEDLKGRLELKFFDNIGKGVGHLSATYFGHPRLVQHTMWDQQQD
jgi:hypothetical protein